MTVRLDYRRRKLLARDRGDCGDHISIASTWGRRQFELRRWEQGDGQGRARGRSLVQLPLYRAVDQARLSDDRIVPWTQSRGSARLGAAGERTAQGGGFLSRG